MYIYPLSCICNFLTNYSICFNIFLVLCDDARESGLHERGRVGTGCLISIRCGEENPTVGTPNSLGRRGARKLVWSVGRRGGAPEGKDGSWCSGQMGQGGDHRRTAIVGDRPITSYSWWRCLDFFEPDDAAAKSTRHGEQATTRDGLPGNSAGSATTQRTLSQPQTTPDHNAWHAAPTVAIIPETQQATLGLLHPVGKQELFVRPPPHLLFSPKELFSDGRPSGPRMNHRQWSPADEV